MPTYVYIHSRYTGIIIILYFQKDFPFPLLLYQLVYHMNTMALMEGEILNLCANIVSFACVLCIVRDSDTMT